MRLTVCKARTMFMDGVCYMGISVILLLLLSIVFNMSNVNGDDYVTPFIITLILLIITTFNMIKNYVYVVAYLISK